MLRRVSNITARVSAVRQAKLTHAKLTPMRNLWFLILALCWSCGAAAQATSNKLADNIDTARTIIAKLDHAAQDDPPPNFASSILVRVHREASDFISLADTVSASVRHGRSDPSPTSMFSLYSQFINLFEQFDLYTTVETRPLALDKVRSTAMSQEYFETKTFLEAVTYALLLKTEEALSSCQPPNRR